MLMKSPQDFTQDNSFANHTLFGGHMVVNSYLLLLLMVSPSLYVSHMFVTRVLLSLVFRVFLL